MFAIPNLYTKLCNYSLSSGKFPTACKLARISVIPKKGDTCHMDNLRPISILSILGKVIEKFVKRIVVKYFEESDMFYKLQYGFRSGRSTLDAVFYLTDKIYKNKNEGLFTSVAFLDLTKAFNCVHHKTLLDKLHHYGFRGMVLKWFESYLLERKQFTKLNEYVSGTSIVGSGVPQGSVLGPILYLIYINDIGGNDLTSEILMFADDSVLIQTNDNETKCCNNLEIDLETTSNYFKSLRLGLNPKKTKVMHFDKGFKRKVCLKFPPVHVNGVIIESVSTFKYLGIWIDNCLKFNVHLDACVKSSSHKIYMLRKLRNSLDQRTALTIYKSMILPLVEYGNCFMLGCTKTEITKIQRIQNKGLKIVFLRDRLASTKLLHKDAKLASWEVRALIASCRLMFKYKFLPYNLEQNRPGTRLQSGPLFKMDRPNSKSFINSVSYKLRSCWNALPPNIRIIEDKEHFDLSVKRFHVSRYFDET